jgi:hypothetical protein
MSRTDRCVTPDEDAAGLIRHPLGSASTLCQHLRPLVDPPERVEVRSLHWIRYRLGFP